MTLARLLVVTAVAACAPRAAAQLSNRAIAVEAGVSGRVGDRAPPAEALALAASAWLEGSVEGVARVSRRSGPRTGGRGADGGGWSGTAGLRLSLGADRLRPQLWIEAGWARVEGPAGPADRLALGAGAGLEWFVARDVSVAARAALRGAGPVRTLDVLGGLAAYF